MNAKQLFEQGMQKCRLQTLSESPVRSRRSPVSLRLFVASFLLLFVVGVGEVCGATVKDTICMTGYAGNTTGTSYITTSTKGSSAKGVDVYSIQYVPKTGQVKGNQTTVSNQWSLYNDGAMPGAITSIEITHTGDTSSNNNYFRNNLFVALGKVKKDDASTTNTTNDSILKGGYKNKQKFLFSGIAANKGFTYFKIYSNEKFGYGTLKDVTVIVTYEVTPCCTNLGTINGSISLHRKNGKYLSRRKPLFPINGTTLRGR